MDYGKAFYYFTKDKNWFVKFAIGSVLNIIPIVNFFPIGYMLKIVGTQPEEENLPEWDDWGTLFKNGFFLFLVFLIYSIPIAALLAITVLLVQTFAVTNAVNSNFSVGAVIIGIVLVVVYAIVLAILTPAIVLLFNHNKSISEALSIGKVFRITKQNFSNIIIVVLITGALTIGVFVIGSVIPLLGTIAALFYESLVIGHLYGQLKAVAFEKSSSQ